MTIWLPPGGDIPSPLVQTLHDELCQRGAHSPLRDTPRCIRIWRLVEDWYATQLSGINDYAATELLALLQDCRSYITPTISTHEELSTILGWCDCGYCTHVSTIKPTEAG